MTNTGTGITGNPGRPQKHDEASINNWLEQNFRDLPGWRRDMILNRLRRACRYWVSCAGGRTEDFEQQFDRK